MLVYHLLQRTGQSAFVLQIFYLRTSTRPDDTVSNNGGMPSASTALMGFGPKLGSDLLRFSTHTGLTPSPARCDFEKSDTVFFNAFPYSCCAYYSIRKTELSRRIFSCDYRIT